MYLSGWEWDCSALSGSFISVLGMQDPAMLFLQESNMRFIQINGDNGWKDFLSMLVWKENLRRSIDKQYSSSYFTIKVSWFWQYLTSQCTETGEFKQVIDLVLWASCVALIREKMWPTSQHYFVLNKSPWVLFSPSVPLDKWAGQWKANTPRLIGPVKFGVANGGKCWDRHSPENNSFQNSLGKLVVVCIC